MRFAILLLACLLGGCFEHGNSDNCDEPLTFPVLY